MELTNINKNYIARTIDGKLIKNITNFGAKKTDVAMLNREGEYYGFGIQFLEDVKPLITDIRIKKAYEYLEDGNELLAVKELSLLDKVNVYGVNIVYKVIDEWLENNGIGKMYEEKYDFELDEDTKKWIKTVSHDELNASFIITDIGKNKYPVVPIDWIGRKFNNAKELHRAMDELDWRIGKPHVTYCCIYSMIVQDKQMMRKDIQNVVYPFYGIITNTNKAMIKYFNDANDDYKIWFENSDKNNEYVMTDQFVISCNMTLFSNPIYNNDNSISILSSTLQKCFRTGPQTSQLLYDTIHKLNKSKPYNIPEHNFIKVSGTRQLLWRSYITIIEDISPYITNDLITMEQLLCLAIITNICPELQLSDSFIEKLSQTLLNAQKINTNWKWRDGIVGLIGEMNDNQLTNSIKLALHTLPMMKGDNMMLHKSLELLENNKFNPCLLTNYNIKQMLKHSDKYVIDEVKLRSIDMHCVPNIILYLQSSINYKMTTNEISSFIWEKSSKTNIRCPNSYLTYDDIIKLDVLNKIQRYILYNDNGPTINTNYTYTIKSNYISNNTLHNIDHDKRQAFIKLFGFTIRFKYDSKIYECTLTGDNNNPVRAKLFGKTIKYVDDYAITKYFFKYINNKNIPLCECIDGYEWTINTKTIKITTNNNNEIFMNGTKIPLFDTSSIMKLKIPNKILDMSNEHKLLVGNLLNGKGDLFKQNLIARSSQLKITSDVFDWINIGLNSNIDVKVWKNIYIKICTNNVVLIGPIDRSGNATDKAIDPLYEGVIWRVMNVLSTLYPSVIHIKGAFKFNVNKNSDTYNDLIEKLYIIINHKFRITNNITNNNPKIKTKLWNHQENTLNKVLGKIKSGSKGCGDASCVGSGKTLVALSIIAKLTEINKTNMGNLIMLPNFRLYKTWIDEINKHTENFNIITQDANGKYKGVIDRNTLFITTMGRVRDHPLNVKWNYVIIDECLTVQNKLALQTEEAWRQVMFSNYGVLMLSATFLRARFDKLYLLLKMLRTQLPETKNYLNAILGDVIVCNVIETDFIWETNTTRFELTDKQKEDYMKIQKANISNDIKYSKLSKYIIDNVNYIENFKFMINKLNDRKILIYARSVEEEQLIGSLNDVSIYPNKNKKHIVTTYSKGSTGLNDLTDYDCILMRPIEPDKIVQIKGRLARPGQETKLLKMEYILMKDTIEEANIYRIEIANNFHNMYIMPLSTFYEKALSYN